MEKVLQDIRYGVRMLAKRPGFIVIAVITLMLGIGATTAIFSVVNTTLLSALPYDSPDRIVMAWGRNPQLQAGQDEFPASHPDYIDWRDQNRVFEHIAAMLPNPVNLSEGVEPERIGAVNVSAGFFHVLGVSTTLGRTFTSEEEQAGKDRVVVLSHALWQRRFGSSPDIVDRTIRINGESYTVVGVMPQGFEFPRATDMPPTFSFPSKVELWMPLNLNTAEMQQRGNRTLTVMARLKQGTTLEQAQADMGAIAAGLEQQHPRTNAGFRIEVMPLKEQIVGKFRRVLLILLAAAGFVLLIACANIASLMLSRAAARQKEIAIRTALGASRLRIVRQLLTESLLLSLTGGAAGLLVAVWGVDLILAFSPNNIPQVASIGLDGRVLAFTLALSIATGIIFGLAPALQGSKPNLNETLKEGGRNATSPSHLTRNMLVISEIALTMVLLIGAGLMIRSFIELQKIDPGFDPRNTVTMQINLPLSKYPKGQWMSFFEQAIERVEALPGVESAAATWQLPLSGAGGSAGFEIEGRTTDPDQKNLAANHRVSRGYFKTLKIPLLRGREFTDQDRQSAVRPVIINETMAHRYWPSEDALGKRIRLLGAPREIIGVVKDANYTALDEEAIPAIYSESALWTMNLVVRADSDPLAMVAAIKNEIRAIDGEQPVSNVTTMEQLLAASLAPRRFNMLLLGVFAALALVLASVGIYGVLSYSVAQRTREIGIRMALGAQQKDVLRLVVGQGMIMTMVGVGIGLAAAFASTQLMERLLFGVSATDTATFTIIPLLLMGVALGATFVPACRATRVDPMVALRCE